MNNTYDVYFLCKTNLSGLPLPSFRICFLGKGCVGNFPYMHENFRHPTRMSKIHASNYLNRMLEALRSVSGNGSVTCSKVIRFVLSG